MSGAWMVELRDEANRQIVYARDMRVRDGHLIAVDFGEREIAAWAPGQWTRFWARREETNIEATKKLVANIDRVLPGATEDDARSLEFWRTGLIAQIEYDENMRRGKVAA